MNFARTILMVVMLLIFTPAVFAYGMYGSSAYDPSTSSRGGFSGYGYGNYPAYQAYAVDENSRDRSSVFDTASTSTSHSFDDLFQNSLVNELVFNERGYASESFGNFVSDGSLDLGDGYNLKVDKCSRRIVNGHVGDDYFAIKEHVCSPVHGRLWKDNSLSRSFSDEQGFDTADNAVSLNQNSINSQYTNTQQRSADTAQTATQKFSDTQSTFGRGVVIVLN